MPVSNNPTRPRASTAAGTAGTAATGGATPASGTPAAGSDPTPTEIPAPSAAGQVGPPKVAITGIKEAEGLKLPSYTPTAGQNAPPQTWGNPKGDGFVDRGYIETSVAPTVGGCLIEVNTFHDRKNDDVSLFLRARVCDPPKEHFVLLGVPWNHKKQGSINGESPRAKTSFVVDYDELNTWLKDKGGLKADGTPKLQFRPGDPLIVDAVWQSSGHQSGGSRDQTKGYVVTPAPIGGQRQVDVRAGGAVDPAAMKSTAVAKPVDLTLLFPDAVVQQYPKVLDAKAKLVSRREHEQKFQPHTFEQLKEVALDFIRISGLGKVQQQKALERMFGEKGWSLQLTDRYYKKDELGRVQHYAPGELVWKVKDEAGEHDFDFAGLPKVAPMHDEYLLGNRFVVAESNGAIRFRDGEYKDGQVEATMGKMNVKPGGGVLDLRSMTTSRLEHSVDTLPGIMADDEAKKQLVEFMDKAPGPYNPIPEYKKKHYGVGGNVVSGPRMENDAHRYKFTLHHNSGLELEVSLDFFEPKVLDGKVEPSSTYGKNADQKYDHWKARFEAEGKPFDATPGAVNKGVFFENIKNQDDEHLLEVHVELSVDDQGKKSVAEKLVVHSRQVEVEMNHVQVRTTGPVQGPYTPPTSAASVSTAAAEDKFFEGLSENATMNGPPTVHTVEDLTQPALYADPSYGQMTKAGRVFIDKVFDGKVLPARQKSAQGLEQMGAIKPMKKPNVSPSGIAYASGLQVQKVWNGDESAFTVKGQLSGGNPMTLTVAVDEFPYQVQLTGNESAKEVADKVAALYDEFIPYKPKVTENNGTFTVTLEPR